MAQTDTTQRQINQEVWSKLANVIQLERKQDASWLAHVDKQKVEELTGIVVDNHILSKDAGINLFNAMSTTLGATALKQPLGYMLLDNNVMSYIKQTYQYSYENTLQAIDNYMIDGTGYGVNEVLNALNSHILKDVTPCVPKGMHYGDLRFTALTQEHKEVVDNFVKARVSLTLTYEKKRSYEAETIQDVKDTFTNVGKALKNVLSPQSENALQL